MADPVTTTQVINDIMQQNLDVIIGGFSTAQRTSGKLVAALGLLEFLLFLWGSYMSRGESALNKGVQVLFKVFVVALITFNWGSVAGWMKGYIAGGGAAAGGGNSMITSMNPAYIASDGFDKVAVIFSPEGQEAIMNGEFFSKDDKDKASTVPTTPASGTASEKKGMSAYDRAKDVVLNDGEETKNEVQSEFKAITSSMIGGLIDATSDLGMAIVVGLVFCFLGLLIIFVHFYVALQLFVLTIDWYLTVAMTQLLIPFAINKHTSPLATAGVQAIVRKSVQLGVMMAVIGMFGNTISGLGLGPSPKMKEVLALLLGSLTMAFMVKNIPQIAGSIFSGGGSSVDVGATLQAAAASVGARVAAPPMAAAGAAADLAGKGAKWGAGKAGGLALKGAKMGAGKMASGVKTGAGKVAQGAQSLAARAGALVPERGGRDAEPKSMDELHAMHVNQSDAVNNQVNHNAQGPMQVSQDGSVQESRVENTVQSEATPVRRMEAVRGMPAVSASDRPAITGEGHTHDQNTASTGSSQKEAPATQQMHGVATQQMGSVQSDTTPPPQESVQVSPTMAQSIASHDKQASTSSNPATSQPQNDWAPPRDEDDKKS